jgi:hypothetical protein
MAYYDDIQLFNNHIKFKDHKYKYCIGLRYNDQFNNYNITFIVVNRYIGHGYSYSYDMFEHDSKHHDKIKNKAIGYEDISMQQYYCGSYDIVCFLHDIFSDHFLKFLKSYNIYIRYK